MKTSILTLIFLFAFGLGLKAQSTVVNGTVTDANGDAVVGAVVKELNSGNGTISDTDGNFSFTVYKEPPFSIIVSSIGLENQTIEITSSNQNVGVSLQDDFNMLQDIVISASRTPERILESPVTVERMDIKDIQETSAATFYDGLSNLKGVDLNVNSLTFKSPNTRGFATFANTRFVQLVDGIDNSSPALNFVLGNLLGMSELDVESVELLPGASSALYGANAFNGILFMRSKNPFDYQGVSAYVKTGVTDADNSEGQMFYDVGVRLAHAFSDKVGVKGSVSYLDGTEWLADDLTDFDNPGFTRADPGYNGLNVYGDEVATTLDFDDLAGVPAGTFGSSRVSRTGYLSTDLMDFKAKNLKADAALHFRPNGDDLEFIYNFKIGNGNTIYQGANHYEIIDFNMYQHKLEAKADNFFLRGYLTTEDAGDSYDTRFAAINLNSAWKSNQQWFGEYAMTYLGAINGAIPDVPAGNAAIAHQVARQRADTGRLMPGTQAFNTALAGITADPSLLTGSKFVDQSKIYHVDANYNFTTLFGEEALDDIQVGGSWRQYSLNSQGTIFTDYDGPINYNEFGAYAQMVKRLADDKLKFTGSIRYDKSELFDGSFSPRASLVFSPDEDKNHNIRASYQTGFRNPTTQDLFIGLDVGNAILVGSAPENLDRYNSRPLNNSPTAQFLGFPATVSLNGSNAYDNAFTLASLQAFGASAAQGMPNPALLEQSVVNTVQPEQVTAFELGYKGAVGSRTVVDIAGYYNQYDNFISSKTVIVPNYGNVDFSDVHPIAMQPNALIAIANSDFTPFQVYTNSTAEINSYGAIAGIDTKIGQNYDFGVNYTWSQFDFDQATDPDFEPAFNTPEHNVKAYIGNDNLIDNLGFKLNWRMSNEYLWQSTFADGVVDGRSIFDGQLSYQEPGSKSAFKVGVANIFNQDYVSAPGAGRVGAQYFIGYTYGQ